MNVDSEVREMCADADPTTITSAKMQEFYDAMIEAMIRYDGIGIAAPQLGYTTRVIVVSKTYTGTPEDLVLINPRLVSTSEKTAVVEQGCLSVPGVFGPVTRPAKVRVKALGRDGKPLDIKAKGMYACILQHEIDHLNGVLFIDKADYLVEQPKSERLKKK
jgi:peptide deformylase